MDVARVSLILIARLGTAAIEPRRRAIARLAQEAPDGPLLAALDRRTHDPVLTTAEQTVTALLLCIVFLMTNKPPLVGSLVVTAIALSLGLASCLLTTCRERSRELGGSAAAS